MISVLYVDDEPSLLDLARIYLEGQRDFQVGTAISAKAGLAQLKERSYDAVISDYLMPEMDGIGFLKKVRAEHGDLPFILFTGKGREEVVIDAINNGADFYLQKGGNPKAQFAELAHKLRQAVNRRRTEHALRLKTEEVEQFFSLSLDMLSIGNFEGRFLRVNSAWEKVLGYSANDLEGRYFHEFVHPEDRERTKAALQALIQNQGVKDFMNRLLAKDGNYHWIEWRSAPFEGRLIYSAARDVTDRMKDEEELQAANEQLKRQLEEILRTHKELASSEGNFRILMENSPEAIYLATREYKFAYVNEAAVRLFGATSAEQLLGTCTLDRIHPSLHDIIRRRVNELTVERKPVETLEEVYLKMDGTPIDVEVNAVPLEGRGDIEMMIIIRDISARKRAQEALRRSEQMLKSVLDTFPGIVFWKGRDSIYIGGNRKAAEFVGLADPSELAGKTDYDMPWLVAQAEAYRAIDRRVMDSGTPVLDVVESRRKAGGEVGWLNTSKVPLRDSKGNVVGVLGIATDITERMQAEHELQLVEERYRRLLEQSFDAVVTHREGRIIIANEAAARLIGAGTAEDLVGHMVSEFSGPGSEAVIKERIQRLYDNPGTVAPLNDEKFRRFDGGVIDVEVMATSYVEDGKPTVQVVFRDVTARKRAEDALREVYSKLSLLNSITRHDILNKISVLQMNLELAREMSNDPTMAGFIGRLDQAVRGIRDHIEFSRIYQDLGLQEPRWQSLEGIISSLEAPPEVSLVSTTGDLQVFADPMLAKVFYNLLDNSVRHGVRCTRIAVSAAETKDGLTIVWQDDGVGVPISEKERIFEHGYGKNTGLGLFITREILAITKISIRETGTEGAGARFEIIVPKGVYRHVAG